MTDGAPVRVGVIGVGRIGRMHAELLHRQIPGAAVGAVFDAFPELAEAVAVDLSVPVARSIDELLASGIDAVAICSSADSHAEFMIAAARAGKAIFCEKPVSLALEEVDRAMAVVQEAGVPFQIGFNRRFDPAHASVAAAVAAGEVGDPHIVRISSRDPAPPPLAYARTSGGLFLDMMIHDFDMARFVTGSEVVEVFARGTVRVEPAFAEVGDIDTAVVTLVHESGCLTAIDNSRQAVYGFDQRVEVFGSAGVASSENPLAHSGQVITTAGMRRPALPYFFLQRYTPSYVHEWQAFVRAVATGAPTPMSAQDARAPLVIGMAAWRSLREGAPVRLDEAIAP